MLLTSGSLHCPLDWSSGILIGSSIPRRLELLRRILGAVSKLTAVYSALFQRRPRHCVSFPLRLSVVSACLLRTADNLHLFSLAGRWCMVNMWWVHGGSCCRFMTLLENGVTFDSGSSRLLNIASRRHFWLLERSQHCDDVPPMNADEVLSITEARRPD